MITDFLLIHIVLQSCLHDFSLLKSFRDFIFLIYFFYNLIDGLKHQHNNNNNHHKSHNLLTSPESYNNDAIGGAVLLFSNNNFETMNNTHVTAQIGGTAILPCIVDSSSPATVTWIRRSDYQLLTGCFG